MRESIIEAETSFLMISDSINPGTRATKSSNSRSSSRTESVQESAFSISDAAFVALSIILF